MLRTGNETPSKVIISLTTTPIRIRAIWPTLNSLLLQSVLPEKIYLWIPKSYKRFPTAFNISIPDFIKNNPFIQVNYIEQDFGPATKLLPCLQLFELDSDTKIIVVDDDRIYAKHFIRDLLDYEKIDPNAAIGIAGSNVIAGKQKKYKKVKKNSLVDVLLGYNGYLVKPAFFSKAVFDYPNDLPEAFFEDDVWISGNLKKKGITRIIIPSQRCWQSMLMPQKKSVGLCEHENKNRQNFLRVFNYFQKDFEIR